MTEVNKYIQRYLQHLYTVEQKSENTILSYKNELNKYSAYLDDLDIEINEITNTVIADYLVYLNEKEYNSLSHALSSIRNFHNYLNRYYPDIIQLTVQIKGKKANKHLPVFLSESQIDKLIEVCNNQLDKTIITTLYATGMRVSELVSLKLNNINLEAKYLRCLGKRNKERIIPLHDAAIRQIKEYKVERRNINYHNSPFFLLNKNGKQVNRQYIYNMIKNYAISIGINQEVSPHSIRHTFATHLLDNGADLRSIQELLGHSDIKTTQIYTHILNRKKRTSYDKFHPGIAREEDI